MATAATNPLRRIGWVYGQVQDRMDLDGASLFETTHHRRTEVPVHEHEFPYLTLLISGRYREPGAHGDAQFISFSAVFHPEHTRHAGVVEEHGCRFFTLELEPCWLRKMDAELPHDSVFDWHGQRFLWLMLRLFREYRDEEARFPLTMESLALEVLAAITQGKSETVEKSASVWLHLREKMHDSFRDRLRIGDLSQHSRRASGTCGAALPPAYRPNSGGIPAAFARAACLPVDAETRALALRCGV